MWLVAAFMPFRSSIVFGIEEDDVDTDGWSLLLNLASDFEQDAYTAGTIVGTINRFFVILFIGIVSAYGRLSQWAQSMTRFLLSGL